MTAVRVTLLASTAVCVAAPLSIAGDWPQWRGPDHNGVSRESPNWPSGWPPRKLWSTNVGAGCSSPIIADGKVIAMGWAGERGKGGEQGTDTVYCLDGQTGRLVWKQSYPARYQGRLRAGDTSAYGGPLATPSFDAATGYIYTLGVDGQLACWAGRNGGRRIWARALHDDFKIAQRPNLGKGLRDYGFTCSPLICGGLLIVQVGDAGGTIVAFDKRTGEKRWSSEYRGAAGHCGGIVPVTADSIGAVAVLTLTDLVLMRVEDGKTLSTRAWQTDFACNLPTPAVDGKRVVLTSGYNQSAAALVDLAGGKPGPLWRSRTHAVVASPVVAGGRLFLVNDLLQCVDMADAKLLWKGGRFGHGSCIATADDKLLVFGNGRLALVDAKAGQYQQLASVENLVKGTCYPQVAFSMGLIVCKDMNGDLVCLSVQGEGK